MIEKVLGDAPPEEAGAAEDHNLSKSRHRVVLLPSMHPVLDRV
jgi:hypothetical protein